MKPASVCTRSITVVCSITCQVPVNINLIAVVCSTMKQEHVYTHLMADVCLIKEQVAVCTIFDRCMHHDEKASTSMFIGNSSGMQYEKESTYVQA